jgi:hypothetical protein
MYEDNKLEEEEGREERRTADKQTQRGRMVTRETGGTRVVGLTDVAGVL